MHFDLDNPSQATPPRGRKPTVDFALINKASAAIGSAVFCYNLAKTSGG